MGLAVESTRASYEPRSTRLSFRTGSNAPHVCSDHQLAETKTPERRYQLAGWHTALAEQVQSVSGSG